ncbi:MAG TPA: PilZ domain-containing protein [Vicinamibacteria bacterium]|nr:PilZ domain-containing protein [Vicinamibacteria bacterium]
MTWRLLVAGLDARSLIVAAPVLQRDDHVVREKASAAELLEDLTGQGAQMVVLGSRLPDLGVAETIRLIRGSEATRAVSVLVLLAGDEPREIAEEASLAGANAVLWRPLDERHLEDWLAKLLAVARRVEARVPVQGQVVGTPLSASGVHFFGLTRNLSSRGMLLASPVRLPESPDLELQFSLPETSALRALGRVVREAGEVPWPYLGYGVEFLFVPPDSQAAIDELVRAGRAPTRDPSHGIHCTLRRDEWIYEILEPVRFGAGWRTEIRRGPRRMWRPGVAVAISVVDGASREGVIERARALVLGGRPPE